MQKELKNITEDIMDQIHNEKIKMRPKIYFILGSVFTLVGLILSFVVSVFLVGLIRFSLRSHGPMGDYRFDQILSSFPWWIIVFAIIGLIVGIWLIRKYDFSFKVNFIVIIVGFVVVVIVSGWIIDSIGLDNILINQGPMKGLMRQYMQDNNIQNIGQGWGGSQGN